MEFPGTGVGGGFVYDGKILEARRPPAWSSGDSECWVQLWGDLHEPVLWRFYVDVWELRGMLGRGFTGMQINHGDGTDIKKVKSGVIKNQLKLVRTKF